jgi:cytosine/uracil/thiamine/allantoin permease
MDLVLILQCVLGAALGLWLHILKKAKEHERLTQAPVTVRAYVMGDLKECGISITLAAILIIGLPELTSIAQQLAWQMFGLKLPALQRTFFVCALLGGFGNSLADIVGAYFGGARLSKFLAK